MNEYYANSHVRQRMREYLGGNASEPVTAQFITAGDTGASHHREPHPLSDLEHFWDEGLDISRSLWDRKSLIAHLDIEYVNFDYPAEPYVEPNRIFDLQRPIEWAVEGALLDHGIRPLHLLSGRGHHFVWRIRQGSRVFKRLARLGCQPDVLIAFNALPHPPEGKPLPPSVGAAFAGLGRVMEYLVHRVKETAGPMCKIPVKLTAVEVGPTRYGREMISLDISEYGDPLNTRVIRVPFSLYLKPWQQRNTLGEGVVAHMPPCFLIPLHEMDSKQGLRVMSDPKKVSALAERASAHIPDQSAATESLINAYLASPLGRFHDFYYSQKQHPPETWTENYDRTPMDALPGCARFALENPNDLLLRPSGMERVVRVMLSLGWHPRHIAGLIRSRFERDFNWGSQWDGYVPALRADFYTRLFSGLVVTGLDDLGDFDCHGAREAKLCFVPDCRDNLDRFRTSLLERKKYERLACRPFNGLFLPEEHL